MVYTQTYEQWSGRRKGGGRKIGRVAEVVKHTEAGADISANATVAQEVARLRGIDNYHRSVRMFGGWIGYSAVDMPSGRVYEARGFFRQTVATQGRNSSSAAICTAGHGDRRPMTEAGIVGVRNWIGEGIRVGAIAPDPLITGHRKYAPHKSCPGHKIFAQLHRLRGVTGPGAGGTPPPEQQEDDETMRYDEKSKRVEEWQHALNLCLYLTGGEFDGGGNAHDRNGRHLKVDGHLGGKTVEAASHAIGRLQIRLERRSFYVDVSNPSPVLVGYICAENVRMLVGAKFQAA